MTPWLSLWLAAAAAPTPAPPAPASFVVVVANNAPSPGAQDLKPLAFADDDGARYFELFELMAEKTLLLSVLDAETQKLHPTAAGASRPPTLSRVFESLSEVFSEIRLAKAEGRPTQLFFVFVGHGSVSSAGEGVMHLLDGQLSRSDLFQKVIAPSPADYNHIIVDACNAFLFVGGRGESQDTRIDRAVDSYLARERTARYPNTGFILSTSGAEEVHEWSGFRAGVFSHEVRSALLGGADVSGDGVVTYEELRAFLQAANGKVKDPRAKLRPWVSAPAILTKVPLVHRRWLNRAVPSVRVPEALSGRWSLEDDRGVRVADFHSADDAPVTLLLPTARSHRLRRGKEEIRIESGAGMTTVVDASTLRRSPVALQSRNGLVKSYRRNLFAIPFGLAFLEGYRLAFGHETGTSIAARAPPPPDRTGRHWAAGALLVTSIGAVTTGLILGEQAQQSAEQYRTRIGLPDEVARFRSEARDQETAANILLGAGAALAAGGLALWLF